MRAASSRVFARPLGHLSSRHACTHRKAILSRFFFDQAFKDLAGFFSHSVRSPAKISVLLFLKDLNAALQRLTVPSLTVDLPPTAFLAKAAVCCSWTAFRSTPPESLVATTR